MDTATKHNQQKFINELHSKWQKKYRNCRKWLAQEDLDAIEELDSFWDTPRSLASKSKYGVVDWS